MRGKTITWLCLIALLVGVMMPHVGVVQAVETKLYVDPDLVKNTDLSITYFKININIENVEDLYAFGIIFEYAPYVSVITPVSVKEGPFLEEGDFVYDINHFKGEIAIASSLTGDVPGVSGSGTLATVTFKVLEAGESPLEFRYSSLINSQLESIPHETVGGYYYGPVADLVLGTGVHARAINPTKVKDELVGVETWTSVVDELVGVETWTSVVDESVGVGDGETTVFYLANTPVGEGSETVYLDGVAKKRDIHYTIDYWTGEITFKKAPRMDTTITADYKYGFLVFYLANSPVIEETETIYVNGVAQERDVDYTIDYWTGEIGFLYLPSDSAEITADYTSYIAVFQLDYSPVVEDSETIYADRVAQTRDVDYTIDYASGTITFLYVLSDSTEITADYEYLLAEQTFDSKVHNDGDVPLQVKVRIDNIRLEDGARFTFWAGQAFTTLPPREPEYLYVDGFDFTREQWTPVGDAPYLDAPDQTNYIQGTYDTAQHRWFSFEDIDLSDGAMIKNVILEGYTNGPYEEGVDYDIYTGNFDWLGSLYAKGDWAWVTPRWVGESASDIDPSLLTEEGLNDLVVLAYFYDPDGLSVGTDILDCLRLKVEFWPPISPIEPPVYTVNPHETLKLDPATWMLRSPDVGTYVTTFTVLYTYYGWAWQQGATVKTVTWRVKL